MRKKKYKMVKKPFYSREYPDVERLVEHMLCWIHNSRTLKQRKEFTIVVYQDVQHNTRQRYSMCAGTAIFNNDVVSNLIKVGIA